MKKWLFLTGWLLLAQVVPAQIDTRPLDRYFARALHDWQVPGMAVALIYDGEVVLAKGYGVREQGGSHPVDTRTNFAIASNTKAFVAAALARLVDEGRLSWDDRVVDYLPEFALYDDYATRHATIRDLLCHRLGLGTFSGDVIWYKSEYPAEEVVRRIRHVPQAYDFRAGYGYSNLMFIAAGEVIRQVTGRPWSEFVKGAFFEPLGMNRTLTSVHNLGQMGNAATPHKLINGRQTPIPWVSWDNMGAAGGIISNVEDMTKWLILQINGGIYGSDTLFSPRQQEEMWTPHNNFRLGAEARRYMPGRHFSGYGLGWGLWDYRGHKVVSHSGGYDGMYSRVTLIPEEGIGVVVLTNAMTGIATPITMRALDAMLGDGMERDWSAEALLRAERSAHHKKERVEQRKAARVPDTRPTLPLEAFAGRYADPFYGEAEVRLENGRLVLDFLPAPQLRASLQHWHYNTFELKWHQVHAWFGFGTVQFVLDNNNRVKGMEFDVPNDDIFFDEIHFKKIE